MLAKEDDSVTLDHTTRAECVWVWVSCGKLSFVGGGGAGARVCSSRVHLRPRRFGGLCQLVHPVRNADEYDKRTAAGRPRAPPRINAGHTPQGRTGPRHTTRHATQRPRTQRRGVLAAAPGVDTPAHRGARPPAGERRRPRPARTPPPTPSAVRASGCLSSS